MNLDNPDKLEAAASGQPPSGDAMATPPGAGLRQRAEALSSASKLESSAIRGPQSPEATQRTLHELQVHQIELEIQNEELRRVQAELDLARARYFELYDLAPVGYLTLSDAGLVLEANLAAATLLGLARSIRGVQPIFARSILKEDQDLFYRHRKRLFETREPQAWEQRMLKGDGTVFWAQLAATTAHDPVGSARPEASRPAREGGAVVCRVVLSDVTTRKLAEEALRHANWRLESIIEGTHVGTWEWNVQSGEMVFNEVWAQIAGYTLAELAPVSIKTWEALGHPDDLRRSAALLERHFAGELPDYDIESRMRHKDGRWVWVQDRGRVITRTAAGKPLTMFGTHTDITERKRMAEEKARLEDQNRQLQKSESLGLMAGAVAHNFNNLLQAVTMSLELGKGDVHRAESPDEDLELAMQAARKAARVSGLMLTYLGQTHCKHESLDLSEVCRGSLAALRFSLPLGVELATDWPVPGPAIEGNADQIQQILANLVDNAWEAMGQDRGIVRLAVTIVAGAVIPAGNRRPLEFQPQGRGDYACVEVADSGGGIAEAEMGKLFDPFFTTKFTGRGLGLPVVLGILRAHAGAIAVESQPGRGSRFRVYLPLVAQPVARALVRSDPILPAQGERSSGGAAAGATVLVVEDEPVVRQAVGLALKREGFCVLTAADGFEAVEQLRQHLNETQCVLCNVSLPRMDGWATMAALHRLVPDLPVILTSGCSEAQVMEGEHPERPLGFLNKPYEQVSLIRAIGHALAQRKG
ncbi:MAG: PAS domain-containing protein [Opitutaceae bacterium]|nr:PAS domain-containing protein [Opitutaceae bacterium]